LSRPNLLIGADRELVLLTGLAAIILIFVVLTWYSALFGIAIWIVVVAALRMMAKADPMMRQVYARHITYRPHYRPTSTPWRGSEATTWSHCAPSAIQGRPSPTWSPMPALVANGVILLKDGSLMAGWYFAGPDSESSTDAERNEVSRQINTVLSRLGSGWMIQVEAVRVRHPTIRRTSRIATFPIR
jgi:type IV secretory pathway TrbD component